MAHRKNNLDDSSDSESMKDLHLDKDDEDIEFQEEKELEDDDDESINEEKYEKNEKKDRELHSLFQSSSSKSKHKYPIIRKHARKISFKSSSSSSSDELDKKIKRDLAENFNKRLTNFEKEQSKSQKEIFEKNFNILKNDFKIIEEYEQIILKDTNIDIMFIMDLTGSMQQFLYEAKYNIKKVTEEITDINPGAKIRLSFVGYRDFENKEDGREYEIINFTDDIDNFIFSLKKLECYGGGDEPEDVAGALNEALKLDWKSNAKYVVLVCDAPCHGRKYHDIYVDNFSEGDPSGLIIEELMLKFKNMNITFYCIEINNKTKKMFDIMKNIYNDDNKFSVELVGSATEKLTFFVAFSASELLGNAKYDKCSFTEVLNKFREESIDKIMKKYNQKDNNTIKNINENDISQSLINQLENINLEGEDKKLIEFINRMSNLDLDIKNNNNSNNNAKNDNINNEDNNYINLNFDQDFFLMNQGEDINYKINGITYNKNNIKGINSFIDPDIIEQNFNTNIKLNFGFPSNNNDIDYNYINFYDNTLGKEMQGVIPKKIKKEIYNNKKLLIKKYCLHDLICEQIADYFNIEIKPESLNYIKFKKNVIYEIDGEENNNNIIKLIISDLALNFPSSIAEVPNKRILQAFSHFSYQITYGELIIMDLNLDKMKNIIKEYNIYFIKENGYKKILEFFSGHVCSDICKYLRLVHPRKKKNLIQIDEQFFSRKYLINYKLCKCCSLPIRNIKGQDYCCKCSCQKIKTIRKKVCEECHALFDYSFYEYNSELINFPKKCKKCCKMF